MMEWAFFSRSSDPAVLACHSFALPAVLLVPLHCLYLLGFSLFYLASGYELIWLAET